MRHGLMMALAWMLAMAASAMPAWSAERASTAGATVHAFTPPLALPGLGVPRRLRVYLPPDYADGTRRYPVIYMFDGQNLFDDATSYAGEWGVDETMDALARDDGIAAIVIGIDHGGERRMQELIPFWDVRFLPNQGEAFLVDVVDAIKPFVDANYRTRPGRADTVVFGSSLGGLEANYAIHQRPEVFGKAGVFSPSFWISDAPYAQARAAPLPADARVYLYMGGKEGDTAVADTERMAALLRERPDADANVALRVVADAEHNETAWRAEFPRAVRWLFADGADAEE
jgi:predicted alpha/beta superfamily hydrolase